MNDSSPTNTKQKEVISISHLYTGSVYKVSDIQARAALRFSFFTAFRRSRPATLRPRGIVLPAGSSQSVRGENEAGKIFPSSIFGTPKPIW